MSVTILFVNVFGNFRFGKMVDFKSLKLAMKKFDLGNLVLPTSNNCHLCTEKYLNVLKYIKILKQIYKFVLTAERLKIR